MDTAAREAAAPIPPKLIRATVYPPGEKPQTFEDGKGLLAAGLRDGLAVCAGQDPETGEITEFYGMPMKLVKAAPSGLVAPGRSSGRILPAI